MTKRKPVPQDEARQHLDRLMARAARAQLALTDGLREMRAISGLTQEQFARHRGVGTRVVKALETGQGNPTVATLNRIADVFGLEVAFVPKKRLKAGGMAQEAVHGVADSLMQMEAALAEQQTRLKQLISELKPAQ